MKRISLGFLSVLLIWSTDLCGQDRIFTYVYQSLVLNKGQKELEVWATYRTDRDHFYRRMDTRFEFEVGLGKRLQTAFYLNYTGKAAATLADTLLVMNREHTVSFSNEWKYKISDPVANAVGSALYGEFTVGLTEVKLEAKLIFDKRIGRVTQAINLTVEPEWEWEAGKDETEVETSVEFELNYGLGVDLGKGFTLGVEARNPNVCTDDKGWVHAAIYAGPTFSYARNDFWINVTFMPQITGLRSISRNSHLNLGKFERYQFRLLFSYIL